MIEVPPTYVRQRKTHTKQNSVTIKQQRVTKQDLERKRRKM